MVRFINIILVFIMIGETIAGLRVIVMFVDLLSLNLVLHLMNQCSVSIRLCFCHSFQEFIEKNVAVSSTYVHIVLFLLVSTLDSVQNKEAPRILL